MKKLLFLLLFILVNTFSVKVQGRISNFYLDNGMWVLLLEDHSQPQIYGAVVVHVGSKNDPVDNTGMAHYLEHLMFKGTDKIGTLDWEKETVHLDSITTLYDILHKTKDETRRKELQMHINRLSNAAAQYAIPNEIDEILSNMGSENVNAFTNYDVTVYHNKFPSNQLEKWLTVYAERFRYPVFRLFQTELEAVYEEYNLNQDYPNMAFYNDFLATAFSNHPYGRDIIGYPSHLKNPQLSAMQEFFCKYYHPNNMTLVLVGDFQESEIQQLLPNTMGKIHNDLANDSVINNVQRMNTRINQVIEPLKEKYIKTVKETSNKMGVLSYQIPGTDHKESIYLELLSKLLNNESNTGILDKIGNSQIILAAESKVKQNLESGLFTIFYAPKAVGQSFEEAERYILSSVDSLCKGKFSDNLFQAVKMEYLRKYVTDKETLSGNFNIVLGLAVKEIPIDDYEQRENIVRGITKNDLVSIANKYLNNNYLILRSDIGGKNVEKLQKPQWAPIAAQNIGIKSAFAKRIEQMPTAQIKPQNLDFDKSIQKLSYNEGFTIYKTSNPLNDIFSLDIIYNYGNIQEPMLADAIKYLNLQGTQNLSHDDFQMELQQLGATMNIESTDEEFHISLSGFDKDIERIAQLCHEKLFLPTNDEAKIQNILQERDYVIKNNTENAAYWGWTLFNYACLGNNSVFLTNPSMKQVKKYTGQQLLDVINNALAYNGYVTYVGNCDINEIASVLKTEYKLPANVKTGNLQIRPLKTYKGNHIMIASNESFLQSNIYFYIMGEKIEEKDKTACEVYNEYMSGSMAGVIPQEIRELRSLGYSAYGHFVYDYLNRRSGYMLAMLGTQCDKTIEGCIAMLDLVTAFPEREAKFETVKISCIKQKESTYFSFRQIPSTIVKWEKQGYTEDPRVRELQQLRRLKYEDLKAFHTNYIANKPFVITIAGDKTHFDKHKLNDIGIVKNIKYKKIVKE